MTKQEAIDKAREELLDTLEALPDRDEIDIMNAAIRDSGLTVQFLSGIDVVAKSLGLPIDTYISEDSLYVHREIHTNSCEYVQLKKIEFKSAALRAALGIDGAGLGGAEDITYTGKAAPSGANAGDDKEK